VYPSKSLKTSSLCPGKPWNLVFASPGKSWKTVLVSVRTLAQVVNSSLLDDPTIRQPGFDLLRQRRFLLNHFRTGQGHCGACKNKWNQAATDLCPCCEKQTMSHIVDSCPPTKLNGSLSQLRSADDAAVAWLINYEEYGRRIWHNSVLWSVRCFYGNVAVREHLPSLYAVAVCLSVCVDRAYSMACMWCSSRILSWRLTQLHGWKWSLATEVNCLVHVRHLGSYISKMKNECQRDMLIYMSQRWDVTRGWFICFVAWLTKIKDVTITLFISLNSVLCVISLNLCVWQRLSLCRPSV